ncbi:MAG: hypothetical protein JJE51_14570 [Thermoanaerobaculia bacterium]|nr:hypothetical protein [Thermoanaerobaculia bacterium]
MNEFFLVTREEIWTGGPKKTLLEERLSHGAAREEAGIVAASDERDDELLALCNERIVSARELLPFLAGARVRIVVAARRAGAFTRTGVTMVLGIGQQAVVSTPLTAPADYERASRAASSKPKGEIDYRGIPIVWRGGSASVLLHEAAGHPAECGGAKAAKWPTWLSVHDEPEIEIDDSGNRCGIANLLAGEQPRAWRRASFSDLPLKRMSNVVVRQSNAPFELSPKRIEIDLVSAGHYDVLNDVVTIAVSAAELVDGRSRRTLAPFRIIETRACVAAALSGSEGEAIRYPGVVCSSEGQELVAGSHAPVVTTVFHD